MNWGIAAFLVVQKIAYGSSELQRFAHTKQVALSLPLQKAFYQLCDANLCCSLLMLFLKGDVIQGYVEFRVPPYFPCCIYAPRRHSVCSWTLICAKLQFYIPRGNQTSLCPDSLLTDFPSPSLKAAAAPGSIFCQTRALMGMFLEYLCHLQVVSSGEKKALFGYQTIFVGKEDASEMCLLPCRQEAPSVLVSGL